MTTAAILQAQAASLRTQAEALLAQADTLAQLAAQPLAPPPSTPYLTIRQLCAKHPAFCASTVRAWVAARGVNGLQRAVVELGTKGGKILLDEQAFLAWVGQHKPVIHTPPQRRRA